MFYNCFFVDLDFASQRPMVITVMHLVANEVMKYRHLISNVADNFFYSLKG